MNEANAIHLCYSKTNTDCCPFFYEIPLSDCSLASAGNHRFVKCSFPEAVFDAKFAAKFFYVRIPENAFTFYDGMFCHPETKDYEFKFRFKGDGNTDKDKPDAIVNTFLPPQTYISGIQTFEMWFQKPVGVYEDMFFVSDLGHTIPATVELKKKLANKIFKFSGT